MRGNLNSCLMRADADAVVFSDELNHASIIDGARLAGRAGAAVRVYRHNDLAHLERLLAACPPGRRRLVVTDSLFSMDGACSGACRFKLKLALCVCGHVTGKPDAGSPLTNPCRGQQGVSGKVFACGKGLKVVRNMPRHLLVALQAISRTCRAWRSCAAGTASCWQLTRRMPPLYAAKGRPRFDSSCPSLGSI